MTVRVRSTLVGACCLTALCAHPVLAQETPGDSVSLRAPVRHIRLVVSGGATVPLGDFATYHDLGAQASVSVVFRAFGQKLRLRPEFVYSKFHIARDKVQSLLASNAHASVLAGTPPGPDLTKLTNKAATQILGLFANLEVPLGPGAFQPYVVGGVGAIDLNTDVTSLQEAVQSITWGMNVGGGLRFKLGPIGAGIEARLRNIPVKDAGTFYRRVTAIPVSFGIVF